MRVLVIGGTHFMGPFVLENLVRSGWEVTCLHRNEPHRALPSEVREVRGDRSDQSVLDELGSGNFDVVLDMCGMLMPDAERLVRAFKGRIDRMVFVSSCDVYWAFGSLLGIESGEINSDSITEDSQLRTRLYPYRTAGNETHWRNDYDKIPMESYLRQEMNATVLRLPMVYGPYDKQRRMASYLKRMVDGRKAILLGRVAASWTSTRGYVENVAKGISMSVINELARGQTYNIADKSAMTEKQWLEEIGSAAGWDGHVVVMEDSLLPDEMRGAQQPLIIDSSKIRRDLGFVEELELEEGIKRTVAWELDNLPELSIGQLNYDVEDRLIQTFHERELDF